MKRKIFISHNHNDTFYAEKIIDILESLGLTEDHIYCTSVPGYDISNGKNFVEEIKSWFQKDIIVILLLSKDYYKSPISLCEMGACWVTSKKSIPIYIPPFSNEEVKGIYKQKIGFTINDEFQLIKFKEEIEEYFNIDGKRGATVWERYKKRFLRDINNHLNNEPYNDNNQFKKTSIVKEKQKTVLQSDGELDLIIIPSGNYNRLIDNKKIYVKDELSISKNLITQSLYENIMRNNPSDNKGKKHPVENVTFMDAIIFCNKLSKHNGFKEVYNIIRYNEFNIDESVKGYRLPYEFEWEFALKYSSEEIKSNLNNIAWFSENAHGKTKEVGEKEPNLYGIHDMLGNVWEWSNDKFKNTEFLLQSSWLKIYDGNNTARVLRGGSSVNFKTEFTEKGFRKKALQTTKNKYTGFRIVLQNFKHK